MSKRIHQVGIAALIAALAGVGCASEEKREEPRASEEQAEAGMQGGEEKVLSEESTVVGEVPSQIGERSESEGETTVPVRREITRTVITQHEIPTVDVTRSRVDVNRMDVNDFMAIGFERQAAENIVRAREERGQFTSVSELAQVEGVDSELISQLEPQLGFSGVDRQAQVEAQGDQMGQQQGAEMTGESAGTGEEQPQPAE